VDQEIVVWNLILSALVGLTMYLMKSKDEELTRVGKLLNQTREQIARDSVTRTEVDAAFKNLQARIDLVGDRLSDKIDSIKDSGNH